MWQHYISLINDSLDKFANIQSDSYILIFSSDSVTVTVELEMLYAERLKC